MESQRFKRQKNDHDSIYTLPALKNDYELEEQAARIYTRSIFFDVQEEIRIACKNCKCRRDQKVGNLVTFHILQVNLPGMHQVFVCSFLIIYFV